MEAIREELIHTVERFLDYAGYRRNAPKYIGFVRPDIDATKAKDQKEYRIIIVTRSQIEEALDGFRDLLALKYYLGRGCDYVLVLPPVSEFTMIEFLIQKEEWYYEIKREGFMIWLCNSGLETVSCIIGWPLNEEFKEYFANPTLANFDHYIGQMAGRKLMEEEFE
jgi:hypothetical protein